MEGLYFPLYTPLSLRDGVFMQWKANQMTEKSDDQQIEKNHKESVRRSGKDRRRVYTMIAPDKDRSAWERRRKSETEKT